MNTSIGGSETVALVLGVHRSGTSLLTSLIEALGFYVGDIPRTGSPENPPGFFEHPAVRKFNDALLHKLGANWANWGFVASGELTGPLHAQDRCEAREILAEAFGDCRAFVLKDPRVSMLLPFWEATFAEMGLSPKRILIIRDPAEVAASQASRAAANPSFHRFAPGAASMHALWLRIMLTILGALPEGSETLLLKHADLFDKPLDSLGAVAQFLGIPVSSDRLITIASEYILPELRRAQRSDGMPDTGIAQVSGRMFEALSQLSPPTTMTGLKAHELTIVDPQLSLFNVLTVPVMETFSSATVAADADRMRTALLRRAVNLFADIAIRDASAGNSEETLHKLSEMAAGGTDDPEIFIFRQGQLCLRLGEYERALQLYSELAKQRPRFAPARVGQMQAYIKLGQPEKANKIREAADALFPKHPAFKVLPASKK